MDLYPVDPQWARGSHCDSAKYREMYQRSVEDPNGFWAEMAGRLDWSKKPTRIKNTSFTGDVAIRWYEDGELNVCYNCVDRHLAKRGNQTAILFEGDDPGVDRKITYRELHEKVSRLANVLKDLGVKKGDRVTIYLPMIPEAAYAMLACARIGAPHSVVFGGFSPDSLSDRINDAECKVLVTADGGYRRGAPAMLKTNVDVALADTPTIEHVVVVKRVDEEVSMTDGRDHWYHELMTSSDIDDEC